MPAEEEMTRMAALEASAKRTTKEKAKHYYKRVEINALSSEELIVLIEREIFRIEKEKGLKQPEPSAEELRTFLSEIGSSDVVEEIKKRAIYEVWRDKADVSIDPEAITHLVLGRMKSRADRSGHWTGCLDRAIEEYMENLVKELAEGLKKSLRDPSDM